MDIGQHEELTSTRRPLRLLPGVIAVAMQWLLWFGVPFVAPEAVMAALIGGLACALAVLVWWLFFSRAPWIERVGAVALIVVSVIAAKRIVHPSIAGGMMGMMLPIYSIPVMCLALVAAAAVGRRLSNRPRRAALVVSILLACGVFTLLRTGGITGEGISDLRWRWSLTPEQRLLAQSADEPSPTPIASVAKAATDTRLPAPASDQPAVPESAPAEAKTAEKNGAALTAENTDAGWPGFRGPGRDSVIRGVRIDTDWSRSKPVELWRHPIGPGWSSFAVYGRLIYTQEQRGEDEVVSCYDLNCGSPVWRHKNPTRFYESNGGAGPRGTPTLSNGRVYTFGATGVLNALDARNGSVIWTRNAAADTNTKIPQWGFASSPLVVGDKVVVAIAGSLAAYDASAGRPRWQGPAGQVGYSSPQFAMIDGVAQILLLNGEGAISVSPSDGKTLWKYAWNIDGIVQPAVIMGGDVLIGSGSGLAEVGLRRLAVARGPEGWSVEERWTSNGLRPYFNDFVVHKGHAFGFDGGILACIDLKDGKRKWKGGRYGHGQIVLLPDQDLLLAISEEGELALVAATSDQFTELSRIPAIEGKTWNHPALAGDVLLVRNGEQMAAFRLNTGPAGK
ncbi:MAG: PQQ-binding-like beta-propeller repeat protein [Chloracidobacterium sp.]|nr:PQQ-binding-like beta-propeller repeat protein [Chloracidobacterium sp.]